jgi:hypothetical protein
MLQHDPSFPSTWLLTLPGGATEQPQQSRANYICRSGTGIFILRSRQPFQGSVSRFQRPHHFPTRRPENPSYKQYPTSPRTTIKRSWSFSCLRWPQIRVCLLHHCFRPYQCCRPFLFESPSFQKANDSCWSPFKRSEWELAVRWRRKPLPSWSIFSHNH